MDKLTHEVFYDKLTFIYLEMPKFKKTEEELTTHFDKWLYVLRNLPKFQERPEKIQEKVFERLFNEAEIAKLNPKDMQAYEESLKVYWDNYSIMETARNEVKKEGLAEGREEERLQIAREMKKDGDSLEKIARITRLTKEHIEKL